MKKLRNKIFYTVFVIQTLAVLIILGTFNIEDYKRASENIEKNLSMTLEEHMKPKEDSSSKTPEEDKNRKFIDANIYSVTLDSNEKIESITSHTQDMNTPEDLENEVSKIVKGKEKNGVYINNLYTDKYSYLLRDNKIVFYDNSQVSARLVGRLYSSLSFFLVFEVIAFAISHVISKWIIRPVEESFNKQKQFIADASHELKTPLSVIMASAEAFEKDKNNKWINNIEYESERMNGLIKDLLQLAKMENEEAEKLYDKNNISKIIEMAILPFESLTYENNIGLKYDIQKDIYLKSNADEIKQLISILMDNAIKHSEKNGEIEVILKSFKSEIILTVKDKGDEIPKGEEKKIFERFYRIDKSRNRSQNRYGLGLSIANKIVVNHSGKIEAKSHNGYTTFTIVFKK